MPTEQERSSVVEVVPKGLGRSDMRTFLHNAAPNFWMQHEMIAKLNIIFAVPISPLLFLTQTQSFSSSTLTPYFFFCFREAILRTSLGDVHIKLFPSECPRTVENFSVKDDVFLTAIFSFYEGNDFFADVLCADSVKWYSLLASWYPILF